MHGTAKEITGFGMAGLLAARAGDDQARIVLDLDGEQASASLASLHRDALRIGAALAAREAPGTRVLLAMPPGPDWYAAFFGCLYARCIAVPVPLLKGGRRLARIADVVQACAAARALCPPDRAEAAAQLGLRFDPLEDLRAGSPGSAHESPPIVAPEDIAYLQFTSGSTGSARGARISHRAVMANVQAIRRAMSMPTGAWHASWLPLHHDMGLVMTMASLVDGGGLALMAPEEFALKPWRWLDLISRWRAAVSGAPNFAFDQLSRMRAPAGAAPLDLSHWCSAFCGAEPVRPQVMRRFARRFAAQGLREDALKPGYGMAEFSLLASMVPPGERAATRWLPATDGRRPIEVSEVGVVVPDHRVIVVDPETRRRLPDGQTGELWLDGPSKASGYWGRDDENAAQFEARTPDAEGGFLRSGDLGFIDSGRLYIVGRLKEVIILRGRNLHPGEIEDVVLAAHPALQAPAAAFGVDLGHGESLGIACELRRGTPSAAHAEVFAAVQRELSERLGVRAQSIVLLRTGSAPRTTSGKLRRLACATLLAAGELRSVAHWQSDLHRVGPDGVDGEATAREPQAMDSAGPPPDAARIRAWVTRWISARHAVAAEAIDPQRPLQDLGFDSMDAVELVYALEDWLQVPLDATLLWRTATLQTLSEELARSLRPADVEPAEASDLAAPLSSPIASALHHIETLSDDEVSAEFARRIGSRTP